MGLHYEKSTHQVFRAYSSFLSEFLSHLQCCCCCCCCCRFGLFLIYVAGYQCSLCIYLCSGNLMGTGAESIVCLSVEWSVIRMILEERLLAFVMSASGKDS